MHGERCDGGIYNDLVPHLEACTVHIFIAKGFYSTIKDPACIRYRGVEFASSDNYIYDGPSDFVGIIVGFSADLREAGTFQMYPFDRYADLIHTDVSGVIQTPC